MHIGDTYRICTSNLHLGYAYGIRISDMHTQHAYPNCISDSYREYVYRICIFEMHIGNAYQTFRYVNLRCICDTIPDMYIQIEFPICISDMHIRYVSPICISVCISDMHVRRAYPGQLGAGPFLAPFGPGGADPGQVRLVCISAAPGIGGSHDRLSQAELSRDVA